MRKLFLPLIALAFIALTSIACGGKKAASTEEASNEPSEAKAEIAHLTKDEYIAKVSDFVANPDKWVFKGDKPMLIDFYATWCPPCKQIAPILEELAKEYEGKIDFYKIDVDQEGELAQAYNIRSIPTLFFVPTEGDPETVLGALSKEAFVEKLDALLKK
ncbi:MAG: thioredoxin [Bacteroidales bacterium]|nr:thioredoxin [Bacteroidales bacterium]